MTATTATRFPSYVETLTEGIVGVMASKRKRLYDAEFLEGRYGS
jgi:hypothetical protein